MKYKTMIDGKAYRLMRSSSAYAPMIYREVAIILTIKLPDGTTLVNQSVKINGTNYTTNASGQIGFVGDAGTSATFNVRYDDARFTDITVTYIPNANYNVQLEWHVIAGSLGVTTWDVRPTGYPVAYSFTVPDNVNIILITCSAYGYDDGEDVYYPYLGTSWRGYGGTVIVNGTGSYTRYVGVTANETYTLYGHGIYNCTISWSDEINTHTPYVTL